MIPISCPHMYWDISVAHTQTDQCQKQNKKYTNYDIAPGLNTWQILIILLYVCIPHTGVSNKGSEREKEVGKSPTVYHY